MAKRIQSFILKRDQGNERQSVAMQRRARILFVTVYTKLVRIFAEVEFDASTEAFEVPYQRHFVLLGEGAFVPAEQGSFIGGSGEIAVYEVR